MVKKLIEMVLIGVVCVETVRWFLNFVHDPMNKPDAILVKRNSELLTAFQRLWISFQFVELLRDDCGLRYSGRYSWYVNFGLHCVLKLVRICIVIFAVWKVLPTIAVFLYEYVLSYDYKIA